MQIIINELGVKVNTSSVFGKCLLEFNAHAKVYKIIVIENVIPDILI